MPGFQRPEGQEEELTNTNQPPLGGAAPTGCPVLVTKRNILLSEEGKAKKNIREKEKLYPGNSGELEGELLYLMGVLSKIQGALGGGRCQLHPVYIRILLRNKVGNGEEGKKKYSYHLISPSCRCR